ncbi:ABC transporter permease [Chitinophaga vietnamensis]|uniref:ABC transporter permease n=1 Tax=Chitinophaga vietnamensis TaxID=2593957 RepID=UPI0011773502|nr:ABC transporter permease [Chitinophaga vietnamensis]
MPDLFKHIGSLFLREAKLVAKDHSLLLTLLLAPLLYAFFYGSIYSYKVEEKVLLAAVDEDRSELSRTFLAQINHLQIAAVMQATDLHEAQQKMYYGDCQGFLYIPKGMQANVLALKQADVVLAVNAARFLPSSELAGAVTTIGMAVGAGVRLRYQEMKGLNSEMAMQEAMPVNLDYRPLFNTQSSYGAFLLPGLLALILQQTLLIGLAESVALERQRKMIRQLVDAGGSSVSAAFLGKGVFYFVLFAAYACFFMTVNYHILQIPFRGHARDVATALALFLLALIPLGMWLGTLFKTQLLAAQLMAFSTYPVFLLAGYAWPYQSLPPALQIVSSLLPTTPFIHMYASIVQAGGTLADNKGALVHLAALCVLYTLLALWRLSALKQREAFSGIDK